LDHGDARRRREPLLLGSPARRRFHRIALSLCFLFKAGRMIENFLARAVQFPGIATRYDWVGGVL
jgi:hypothetical protein